jgi:hypothetical protein
MGKGEEEGINRKRGWAKGRGKGVWRRKNDMEGRSLFQDIIMF